MRGSISPAAIPLWMIDFDSVFYCFVLAVLFLCFVLSSHAVYNFKEEAKSVSSTNRTRLKITGLICAAIEIAIFGAAMRSLQQYARLCDFLIAI